MLKSIFSEIDAEIFRLQQAKALLSSTGAVALKRKPGRTPQTTTRVIVPKVKKAKKRRKMSAEARERIRQAQIKRWAARKQPAKPSADATVNASPSRKKKAAKGAA